MKMEDRAGFTLVKALGDLLTFRADIVHYSFRRHDHGYYAVGIIEDGFQKFRLERKRCYLTPPNGISIINPGDAHTGESATDNGFRYWAIYPSVEQFSSVASEMGNRGSRMPEFPDPVISDDRLFNEMKALRFSIDNGESALAQESLFLRILAELTVHYAASKTPVGRPADENTKMLRVKQYIEENYMHEIRLDDLVRETGLSRYYLIRAFTARMGLPPHAYLESVRVRRAQELIRKKRTLVDIAYEIGFCNQSHFSSTFKAVMGVSPGKYSRAIS